MFHFFLVVVDEVAAHPVGAEADGVKRTARLSFVLWVSAEVPQLFLPVGKLALAAILAQAALGERSTQFSLIARRGGGNGRVGRGGASVQCRGADVTLGVRHVSPGPA